MYTKSILKKIFTSLPQLHESTDLSRLLSAPPADPWDFTCLDTENISELAIPAFSGGAFRANYLLRAVNYLLWAEQAIFPSKGGSATHGWTEVRMWECPQGFGWNRWGMPSPGRSAGSTGLGGCGDGGSGPAALPALQWPPPRRGPAAPRSLPARPAAGSPAGEAGRSRSLFPAGGRATMAGRKEAGRRPGRDTGRSAWRRQGKGRGTVGRGDGSRRRARSGHGCASGRGPGPAVGTALPCPVPPEPPAHPECDPCQNPDPPPGLGQRSSETRQTAARWWAALRTRQHFFRASVQIQMIKPKQKLAQQCRFARGNRLQDNKSPYPFSVDPKFIWFHVMHSSCEVIWYKLSLLWKNVELDLKLQLWSKNQTIRISTICYLSI